MPARDRILATALAGLVSIFLISHFIVWAAWNMYPRSVAGLIRSYDAGLPFFRRAVVGDLLFTSVMFATPVSLRAVTAWLNRSSNPSAPV